MNSKKGITDLAELLENISPSLHKDEFVFITLKQGRGDYPELEPLATFIESEGLSLVVTKQKADDAGLDYSAVFKCITLTVFSSLSAVGLTAAVSGALARAGISANIVAAFHHDHLFVPVERAVEALGILKKMGGDDVRVV